MSNVNMVPPRVPAFWAGIVFMKLLCWLISCLTGFWSTKSPKSDMNELSSPPEPETALEALLNVFWDFWGVILGLELFFVLSHFFLFLEDFLFNSAFGAELLGVTEWSWSDSSFPAEFTNWEGYELFDSSSSFPASPNGFLTDPERSRLKLFVLLASPNGEPLSFLLENGSSFCCLLLLKSI